ncbi:hypothetical protein ANCCAN_06952 [Ancylostoma caninum]|uniref:Uncharacterized protein n=1 Tax=Ancylostoma caninum TaxID=29170 RepID=A0A368GRM5_ANCCA|nr:hypothetical protein ANCCAN_06952 [Ancylostoma caninum]
MLLYVSTLLSFIEISYSATMIYRAKKNQAAIPTTEAHVNENGTLVINSFHASDVGDYFSPDELERVCY